MRLLILIPFEKDDIYFIKTRKGRPLIITPFPPRDGAAEFFRLLMDHVNSTVICLHPSHVIESVGDNIFQR